MERKTVVAYDIEVYQGKKWKKMVHNTSDWEMEVETFKPITLTPSQLVQRRFVTHYKYKPKHIRVIKKTIEITEEIKNTETIPFEP